jgi:hypothetical protein
LTGANERAAVASLLAEVGINLPVVVYTDSSSGKAICSRLGAGSQKHIETRYFHIQSMVRNKRLVIQKVEGEWNPADIGTKPVPKKTLERLLPLSGLVQFGTQNISKISVATTTSSSSSISNATLLALVTFLQTLCQVKGESYITRYDGEKKVVREDQMTTGIGYFKMIILSLVVGYIMVSLLRDGRKFTAYFRSFFKMVCVTQGTQTDDVRVMKDVIYISPGGETYHHHDKCQGLTSALTSAYPRRLCLHCAKRSN